MLVLTRTAGEKVIVRLEDGAEIAFTVLGSHRGTVRVGVDAPRSLVIFREELRCHFTPRSTPAEGPPWDEEV